MKQITFRLDAETAHRYRVWLAQKDLTRQIHLTRLVQKCISAEETPAPATIDEYLTELLREGEAVDA